MERTTGMGLAMLRALLETEAEEQASWPREPVTAFRALTGDPRNESGGGDAGDGGGDGGDGGGSGEGDGDGGGEGGGSGKEPTTADIMAAFDGFRQDITTRFDGFEQRIPAEDAGDDDEGEVEEVPDFFAPENFSDEDFDDRGFLTREAQQRALMELVDQRVAEARAPELRQQQEQQRVEKANALADKYPVFADPEKYTPILREAQQKAASMARALGNPAYADMWRDPDFLETTYLAGLGASAAAAEAGGGSGNGDVVLERGGSAGPGSGSDDGGKAIAAGIVATAKKSKFRLGS